VFVCGSGAVRNGLARCMHAALFSSLARDCEKSTTYIRANVGQVFEPRPATKQQHHDSPRIRGVVQQGGDATAATKPKTARRAVAEADVTPSLFHLAPYPHGAKHTTRAPCEHTMTPARATVTALHCCCLVCLKVNTSRAVYYILWRTPPGGRGRGTASATHADRSSARYGAVAAVWDRGGVWLPSARAPACVVFGWVRPGGSD